MAYTQLKGMKSDNSAIPCLLCDITSVWNEHSNKISLANFEGFVGEEKM